MADTRSSVMTTHVAVADGNAHITMGDVKLSVPLSQIEALKHLLEYARLVGGPGVVEAEPATPRVARPIGRPPRAAAARPAAAAAPRDTGAAGRKSRKRVGDAIEEWMQENPGWHTEEQLLQAIIENQWTEAAPKRALKIALGKGRRTTFEDDGHGHWKLLSQTDAGEPPVRKKTKGKPGRRPSVAAAKRRAAREAAAKEPKKERLSLGEQAAALSRGGLGKRLKARPKVKSEGEKKEAEAKKKEEMVEAAVARPARVVRLKKGQDRRQAIRPTPEAKPEAKPEVRWKEADSDLRERARRNLLGLGSAGAALRTEPPKKV